MREFRHKYRTVFPEKYWASKTLSSYREKYIINITLDELITLAKNTKYCSFCNPLLNYNKKDKCGLTKESPTLDRINNENIINIDNVEILCFNCNLIKHDRTKLEFINYCKNIIEKFSVYLQ